MALTPEQQKALQAMDPALLDALEAHLLLKFDEQSAERFRKAEARRAAERPAMLAMARTIRKHLDMAFPNP